MLEERLPLGLELRDLVVHPVKGLLVIYNRGCRFQTLMVIPSSVDTQNRPLIDTAKPAIN